MSATKSKTSASFKKAGTEVQNILKLITSGPRFRSHLDRIAKNNNLSPSEHSKVLNRGMRNFLGYN